MRIFKKIIIFILSIALLLFIVAFFYMQHLKPKYSGNINLKNLTNKVEVYYDNIGVPHIYAENQRDAYVTLGYVHAQDRLWQMELLRRIASGRLSEIFGKDKEIGDNVFINNDKFFLGLGIEDAAIETIKKLDTTSISYKLTEAYLEGINQFIDEGPTPIEFKLIKVKKEHYELKDIYNVFGFMSFSFAMAHKTDPLLSKIKERLDPKYLAELGVEIDPKTTLIPNFNVAQDIKSEMVASVDKIMNNLPVSPFIGSNAWVVGPQKTATGKVIFANDPHISFSQPSVWYQAHIVCPDFEIYGFHLALTPFPLLGHNRNQAYGLTMFENDDIDFYREKLNPNNAEEYLIKDKSVAFNKVSKTINIKGGATETFDIKYSKHGPIMNNLIEQVDENDPIAMDWIYTKFRNKILDAMYEISHANSMESFRGGVAKIHAPGLNVMYGDNKGNIGWFAAGKLYNHTNQANTKFILDGSNDEDDKITYIDFSGNPQSINPEWNYVYSANNQPDKIKSGYYPGYYLPEDRAKRIVDQLGGVSNVSVNDMKNLINDVTSSVLPNLLPEIIKNIDKSNLNELETLSMKILRNWDGSFELNQVAPTIFEKFKYQFFKNTFEDELGETGFKQFIKIHLAKRQFAKQIKMDSSIWNDNISSVNIKETKRDNITKAFKETIKFLENQHGSFVKNWQWKNVHTVEYNHALGTIDALRKYFNVGPFPTNGSNEVLNNQIFSMTEEGVYKVTGGPSTRRIVDFNDVDNSIAILPTGQSGNVFSKHYKDQAQSYLKGKFFKMLINKEEIQKSEDKLIISPK